PGPPGKARAAQGRDRAPPARGAPDAGQENPGADRPGWLRRRPDHPRRLPARDPPALPAGIARLPAHELPPRGTRAVRPVDALAADPGRLRPGAARLRGRLL